MNVSFSLDLVECLELNTTSSEEVISRLEIERTLSNYSPVMNKASSPRVPKKNLPKAQQNKMQNQSEGLTIDHFPKILKGDLGITARVQSFLEVSNNPDDTLAMSTADDFDRLERL